MQYTTPCAGVDLFTHEDAYAMAAAKRICQTCPVVDNCLDQALTQGEEWFVWGGLTPAERGEYSTLSVAERADYASRVRFPVEVDDDPVA